VRPFGDRALRYAVEPGLKAGGVAAFIPLLASVLHVLPEPSPRLSFKVVFVATFFLVAVGYTTWRLYRRRRDNSSYRPTGNAWTIDEDTDDARRITAVGAAAGSLIVALFWLVAKW